ncbi:unnamed protein product, partial [Closterium sp. NIES-53]
MNLITCTHMDLSYPLRVLARFVATERHRPTLRAAAVRVHGDYIRPWACTWRERASSTERALRL